MQNSWGQTRCILGDVQVSNTNFSTSVRPTPRYGLVWPGQYLTHAHNYITSAVAAMDSCNWYLPRTQTSLSLSMKMCAQRKAGRRQRARRRFARCLYPSHGPLRLITSRSRFALASTMRKTKRRRLNWYCLEKTPGIPGSINTILYEEVPGHPEVQPLNHDRNGTHLVYPLLTNGTPFTYNCEGKTTTTNQ